MILSVNASVDSMFIFQAPFCLSVLRRILLRLPTVWMVPRLPLASVWLWVTPGIRYCAQICTTITCRQEKRTPQQTLALFKVVKTLHWEWCVTCRIGQHESNWFSCDVNCDMFQRFIQHEGEGFLPRVPCSLKNCHLMESEQQWKQTEVLFSNWSS